MPKQFYITKASGESVKFSEHKLISSLQRSGASKEQIASILNAIRNKLFEGISTKQIYKIAFNMLKENSKHIASKYHLKRAIMELGPSGYPFEHFIGEIFSYQGFSVKVGIIVKGQCVQHEIDVIAEKGNQLLMVECKYHNQQGIFCDVKIPLYINSRFIDVQTYWQKMPATKDKEYEGLYPITCISSLTKSEKQQLLENKIVLCQDLYHNPKILEKLRIKQNRIDNIIEETKQLCKNLFNHEIFKNKQN